MFLALYAHHQEAELYWCSVWYNPLSQWPSDAQVERTQPDTASIQFSLLMMSIKCLKHVEDYKKLIVK